MHKVTETKNRTAHPLVAAAEKEYEKARATLSKAAGFQYLPLEEQVLYLLHEPLMKDFDDNQLEEVLTVMKAGNWVELANSATGVYAKSMDYDGETNTLTFSMRQKDEPDADRAVKVSFSLAEDGAGTVKVVAPEPVTEEDVTVGLPAGYKLADSEQVGEDTLDEWAKKATDLAKLADEVHALVSGVAVPEDKASASLLERVHAKMDAYETRERKWGFGTKTEHVTRSYEEACAVVAAEGDGGAQDAAGEYLDAIEKWMPVVQARVERTERDQAASRAFSKVAEALVEQGWSLETPDAGETSSAQA